MRQVAFIGLGSNLDNPVSQIESALAEIARMQDTALQACSSFYRSVPVGYLDQPDFVNAVAKVETALAPEGLLQGLLAIEQSHGRTRHFRNAPRTLDLDVLLYGNRQIDLPGLCIPHPQMRYRAFVLKPLLEISPDCVIPGQGPAAALAQLCLGQELERIADVVAG